MHKIVAALAAGLWMSACSSSPPSSAALPPSPQKIPIGQLPGIDADAVLAQTKVLSSDQYEGRGPGTRGLATIVEVPGCGHAPALNVPEQLDLVTAFIDRSDAPWFRQR